MNQTHNFIEYYENDVYYGRALNNINDLKTYLEDKLFISVGGGIGSGKSYFIDNVLKKIVGNFPVYDVDDLTTKISKDKSFIYTDTNSNINGFVAKLQLAKSNGFTTVLIHIDTPEDVAIKQVSQRAEAGERNPIDDYKIIRTTKDSKDVFEKIKKDRSLVDFYFLVKR